MTENEQIQEKNIKHRSRAVNRMLELYIWIFISLIVAFRPIFVGFTYGLNSQNLLLDFYTEVLLAILTLLFPYLFKLIFDEFPFEYLRNRKKNRNQYSSSKDLEETFEVRKETENRQEVLPKQEATVEELHILESYLRKAQKVADKIYSRGGAYLLIGCLIAFVGVLFFYFQSVALHNSIKVTDKDFDYSRLLLEYLPRIGTLIFVEAIAFFFLRQYRQTMEEFRYYEAIKRQRENQYAIFKLIADFNDKPELFDKLISYCAFGENPSKLSQGETTTLIETEKIIPKDSELFDKLIELVKISKK